jgi:ABC-2 type transport system permease protein
MDRHSVSRPVGVGVWTAYHCAREGMALQPPVICVTASMSNATHPVPSPAAAALAEPGWWLAARTLWRRDMVRFFRQRNRVVGALATPIVFWLLLGSGLSGSFQPVLADPSEPPMAAGLSYLQYFFPGTVVMILLFTSIFSTITVIEDRREGFLQGVLVSPAPRLSIVLGKVLGGASIAIVQGLIFLAIWPLVGPWPGTGAMLGAMAVMGLLAVGLTALGLCVAWPMDSTAGFHAVMNLLLMPMWFLSGSVFPPDSAPAWLRGVMLANPLTYGQSLFSWLLTGGRIRADGPLYWPVALAVSVGFTLAALALAVRLVTRPRKDGLS